jgi:uncharacterized protein
MSTSLKTLNIKKVDYKKTGFFRFKKLDDRYLITNDIGQFLYLKPLEFLTFIEGKVKPKTTLYSRLLQNNFLRDSLDFDSMIAKYQQRNAFLAQGPSLHIVVVTLRCDHKCVYCQAASRPMNAEGYDMDKRTAKKVVDTIFETPSKVISIEFQGGEPLANWPVVKYIVEYARQKNKTVKKELHFTLVSNFSLMDEEKFKWIFKNKIGVCTSIDGPREVHDLNRPRAGKESFSTAMTWLEKVRKEYQARLKKNEWDYIYSPGALITVTRRALKYPVEIVNTYRKLGLNTIFLRPLAKLGFAKETWETVGYEVKEFVDFYKKALNYIIKLNMQGKLFIEYTAMTFLVKILGGIDPGQLDLRTPCGAGIGQLLYNYNGEVYTCDEGRMLQDDLFRIGNVFRDDYKDLINSEVVKTTCTASCLDGLYCDRCVYKPYCGVCPAWNYGETGTIFTQLAENRKHLLNEAILDFIFKKMENIKVKKVFEKWVAEYAKQIEKRQEFYQKKNLVKVS